MNHSEFRKWVEGLTKEQCKASGLKSATEVKAICFVLANYGDYATGTNIKVSWVTVAKASLVSRTTALKVRDWLLAVGAIEETGKTEGNISIYRFQAVVQPTWTTDDDKAVEQLSNLDRQLTKNDDVEQLSILEEQLSSSVVQLSIWDEQLSILGGHNSTLDSKEDSKDSKTTTGASPVVTTSLNLEVKEESVVPACPVLEVSTSLNSESDEDLKNFNVAWTLLDEDEKKVFEKACGTQVQLKKAVLAYRNQKFVNCWGWRDRATEALKWAGVEVQEW